MNKTAIQTTPPLPPSTHGQPLDVPEASTAWGVIKKILTPVASLRLTVVMFVLAIALVFLGTLAQVDEGIWTVLSKYFRTGIAWIPFQALVRFGQVFLGVSPHAQVSGSFPLPGGWLIGGILLVNLLAAHAVRFKLTWKRTGILMIHSGLVLMMLGELITGLFALEGRMPIPENWTVNFVEDHRTHAEFGHPSESHSRHGESGHRRRRPKRSGRRKAGSQRHRSKPNGRHGLRLRQALEERHE